MNKLPRNTELGDLLKQWRGVRGRSQLDISLDTGISQRQISFIESGRSVPGRSTLMGIAQADEMKSITKALARMIARHEPYPAIIMDRYWNVLLANDAAPRFFGCFIDMSERPAPRNLLHLMFDPKGMRPFIANWEALAKILIQRVHQEATGHVVDQKTKDLVADLLAYPDVQPDWRAPETLSTLPMIPISFVKDGAIMNYFSLVTTVGTPQAIAAQELRVECMYPADDETEVFHAKLLAAPSATH